jgi:SMP-30/Gluconolactonase/LRE-like region
MKKAIRRGLVISLTAHVLMSVVMTSIVAHPGSGIVVDRRGEVYFLDTGSGVWKIDLRGKLTHLPGPRFHWMALDSDDCFGATHLPTGAGGDVTRVGSSPTLLVASDYPIVIGANGYLYYSSYTSSSGLQLMQLTPADRTTVLTNLSTTGSGNLRWLNGLAAGADGSLYYTEDDAIRRISAQGAVSTVAVKFKIPTCVSIAGTTRPMLRGLAVDSHGTIYVAASGCGSVLKVSANGQVTTLHQLQSPWTPTAVALFGSDVYVLEYLQTAASMQPEDRSAWLPRVRKITGDGHTKIIASIDHR